MGITPPKPRPWRRVGKGVFSPREKSTSPHGDMPGETPPPKPRLWRRACDESPRGLEERLAPNLQVFATAVLIGLATLPARADDLEDEVLGYMDFATETQGIILPEQITREIFEAVHFVDTRSAEAHARGTIPGARHINWRELPGRMDELPEGAKVVLFCNTGVLSH